MTFPEAVIAAFAILAIALIANNLIDSWRAVNLARYPEKETTTTVSQDWDDDTQVIHTLDTD